MKVYTDLDQFKKVINPVVTIGTFDGVHIGHRKIIQRIKEIAKKENGETVLFTFFPHPRMILHPEDNNVKLITTQEEKIELLANESIDHLIIHPFTPEFSNLSSLEFIRNILVDKIGTKKLVIGYNHHFGKNREGSFKHLKEFSDVYGFEVEEIPAQDIDSVSISSTKIRRALLEGDVETANLYLGHYYQLSGEVVEGDKLGREIGFPTANILVREKYKLIPANGVYAVDVAHEGERYKGMLNIGIRPTVNNNHKAIEVNIFNFDKNIYGKRISVFFKKRIRDEKKFENLNALRNQLIKDKQKAITL